MTAADVLVRARAAGVEVLIYDGKLASRGPATAELRAAIRTHKPELIALLTGKPGPRWPELPPLPDDDERAGWLRGDISFTSTVAWADRSDVTVVVEDLINEGMRPGKIARTLGLRRHEVLAILRSSGQ